MNVIYKYPLIPLEVNRIMLPEHHIILTVGFQGVNLFLWVVVDTDSIDSEQLFFPAGTGLELQNNFIIPADVHKKTVTRPKYVGSAVSDVLVWHVFHLQPLKH